MNSEDEGEHERRENDWQATKHSILVWWHGGESSRQKIRRATQVYRQDEGFEEPANPKYHWTAAIIRWPIAMLRRHIPAIIAAVIAGITVLLIYDRWFKG